MIRTPNTLQEGGLWWRIVERLQFGPVPHNLLFLRVRDVEIARAPQKAKFQRALDLMARAGLVARLAGGCVGLTEHGEAEIERVHDERLLAAWADKSDAEVDHAIGEAEHPVLIAARIRVRDLRRERRSQPVAGEALADA